MVDKFNRETRIAKSLQSESKSNVIRFVEEQASAIVAGLGYNLTNRSIWYLTLNGKGKLTCSYTILEEYYDIESA